MVFEYQVSYGSTCCLRDPKWNEKEGVEDQIKRFEKENTVVMKGTYMIINGKEGERSYYFSFLDWSDDLKNKFLSMRSDFQKIENSENNTTNLESLIQSRANRSFIKKIN